MKSELISAELAPQPTRMGRSSKVYQGYMEQLRSNPDKVLKLSEEGITAGVIRSRLNQAFNKKGSLHNYPRVRTWIVGDALYVALREPQGDNNAH